VREHFPWASKVEVVEQKTAKDGEVDFAVQIRGTSAERTWYDWPHEVSLFFGAIPFTLWHVPVRDQVRFLIEYPVNTWGAALAMLVSTIVTAFFVPNMLRKGTIDLLLVKPISRPALLLCKFLGGLTFMFLNTVLMSTPSSGPSRC
jgi:hypothetical protein